MAVGVAGVAGAHAEPSRRRKRVLRAAHLTDIHVLADAAQYQHPEENMAAAIRQAQGEADPPDLLLFGGDMVMDNLFVPKEAALAQWAVWRRIFSAEVRLPHHFAVGNHDIWGWAVHDQPGIDRDPDYGKGLALREFGLKRAYYSFDRAGWRFFVLDSMQFDPADKYGCTARLDDDQFAWFGRQLAATPASMPVCVLSHVPILAVCPFVDQHLSQAGIRDLPGILVHLDAYRIKNLFDRFPNVKLCLSGHVHLADDITYRGVRYCCNGAVCGNWWRGPYEEYAPAYALVDFYDDGSVDNTLVPYRPAA